MGPGKSNELKVVLVTGAGSGIGRAVAIRFAQDRNYHVLVADINEINGNETLSLIKKDGGQASFFKLDIRKVAEVEELASVIKERFGGPDVLINNAAVEHAGTVTDTSIDDWENVIDINLTGLFLVSKHLIPLMMEAKKGAIVNTASISGLLGWPDSAVYCATKGAVVNLTREMAVDYASYNIRVNCVCPGTTKTPMISRLLKDAEDSEIKAIMEMHPLNRFAEPSEIAEAIYFLASEDASFITGAIMPVDGGYTAK